MTNRGQSSVLRYAEENETEQGGEGATYLRQGLGQWT
jgi:hypothetical protein